MQTESKAPRKQLIVEGAVTPKNGHTAPPPAAAPPKFVASQLLDVDAIEADPHNPRKDFPKEALAELAASFGLHGVLSPIEVRPVGGGRYRITFGERRFRAAKLAGLEQVPAIVRPLTDLQAAEEQLDENLKRAELSPLEVAGGYQRQLDLGRTMDQVCERAGRKRSAVYGALQLLQLGEAGRKALGEEKISASVAQLVARVPKSLQERALGVVLGTQWQGPLSFRDAEKALQQAFTVELKKASFDTKDEKLCPSAGSCDKCPKRSGNARDLFPDIKGDDVCTDKACFDAKVHADVRRDVEGKGYTLLPLKDAPPEELFWNEGTGALKDDRYIEPDSLCYEDAQNRKYRDLLPLEQFKKVAVVALDASGKPRQLLPKAGLTRELKKGGVFKEKTARQAKAPSPKSSSAPKEYKPPEPTLEEKVDLAVLTACVAAVEKNPAKLAVLEMMAREALRGSETVYQRRGLKEAGYGIDEKTFKKTFGKLSFNKLVALIFDALLDRRYAGGDGFDDVAPVLGVDVKKLRAQVERAALITWSTEGKKTLGKGNSGTKYTIKGSASGKNFELEHTSPSGSTAGVGAGLSTGWKSLDEAKENALKHEERLPKKGGGR